LPIGVADRNGILLRVALERFFIWGIPNFGVGINNACMVLSANGSRGISRDPKGSKEIRRNTKESNRIEVTDGMRRVSKTHPRRFSKEDGDMIRIEAKERLGNPYFPVC